MGTCAPSVDCAVLRSITRAIAEAVAEVVLSYNLRHAH
jgi:hypothetical protein